MEFYERQEINRRRTIRLMGVHAAVFAALGLTVDAVFFGFPRSGPAVPPATAVALCISMTVSWLGYYRGDRTLLESLLARPLDESDDEQRQLGNIVREISLAAGIPPPSMYVIPDKAPNAMATGRDPEHAALAVTSGALALLDREETQGVIAHEIGHIASGDTAVMMMVGALFGSAVILADWARRMLFFARIPTPLGVLLFVPAVFLSLVSPLLSRLMALAVSRTREYHADATAVELTRNPTGLARALAKIARTRSPLRGATRGTAHMFIVNPLHRRVDERSSGWADLFATHPPLDHRIALLEGRAS